MSSHFAKSDPFDVNSDLGTVVDPAMLWFDCIHGIWPTLLWKGGKVVVHAGILYES